MASIHAIDAASVNKITSGQVVIDLQTCIKELVENSLDAGATSIDVRFKNYGLGGFEVIDNGSGIPEEDHDRIGLKYHTSKLSSLADLTSLESFGFRGEALASICALSERVVITTATKPSFGVALTMDAAGRVKEKIRVAHKRGTTIAVTNLFAPLPVRRKELERNIKREYNKALTLLNAYALVPCCGAHGHSPARLTVSNISEKGLKHVSICTTATSSLRTAVRTLWGQKAATNLIDLDISFTVDSMTPKTKETSPIPVKIQGLVSDFAHGCGRPSADRQFFYVNARPCNLSKMAKAFNEVYRTFNLSQVPFLIANIILPTDSYDVNVTPDKRTIFVHGEVDLISSLKIALEERFSANRATFSVANTQETDSQPPENSSASAQNDKDNQVSQTPATSTDEEEMSGDRQMPNRSSCSPPSPLSPHHPEEDTGKRNLPATAPSGERRESPKIRPSSPASSILIDLATTSWASSVGIDNPLKRKHSTFPDRSAVSSKKPHSQIRLEDFLARSRPTPGRARSRDSSPSGDFESDDSIHEAEASAPAKTRDPPTTGEVISSNSQQVKGVIDAPSPTVGGVPVAIDCEIVRAFSPDTGEVTMAFDLAKVKAAWLRRRAVLTSQMTVDESPLVQDAGLGNLDDLEGANSALSRIIVKDDFSRMEVLGQFNLGFIIARRRAQENESRSTTDDLFIIDQHASDEKYNFETLQNTVHIQSQKLLRPCPLELTATDELLAWEHIDIIRQNGFDLQWDDELCPAGRRLKLLSHPVSKSTVFDVKDLEEIIHQLHDHVPGQIIRCSKSRAMFASRACRKSVMIGMALTKPQMRKIVGHMGQIDQPWNCPHGRPTMRHLIDLDTLRPLPRRNINWMNLTTEI